MTQDKGGERRRIFYNIQVGPDDNPRWRHWGYSVELGPLDHRKSTACDFCKTESGKFFKTTCHCGSAHVGGPGMEGLKVNASYSPETGDYNFDCCEQCVNKLEQLVERQSGELLNHEILIKVIRIVHAESNENE